MFQKISSFTFAPNQANLAEFAKKKPIVTAVVSIATAALAGGAVYLGYKQYQKQNKNLENFIKNVESYVLDGKGPADPTFVTKFSLSTSSDGKVELTISDAPRGFKPEDYSGNVKEFLKILVSLGEARDQEDLQAHVNGLIKKQQDSWDSELKELAREVHTAWNPETDMD